MAVVPRGGGGPVPWSPHHETLALQQNPTASGTAWDLKRSKSPFEAGSMIYLCGRREEKQSLLRHFFQHASRAIPLFSFDDFTQAASASTSPSARKQYAASQQCIAMMAHSTLIVLALLSFFASASPVDMPTNKRAVEAPRAEVQSLVSATEVSSCSLNTLLFSTQIPRRALSPNHPPWEIVFQYHFSFLRHNFLSCNL